MPDFWSIFPIKTNNGIAIMLKLPMVFQIRRITIDRELGPHRNSENRIPTLAVVQASGTPRAKRRKNARNISTVRSSGLIL